MYTGTGLFYEAIAEAAVGVLVSTLQGLGSHGLSIRVIRHLRRCVEGPLEHSYSAHSQLNRSIFNFADSQESIEIERARVEAEEISTVHNNSHTRQTRNRHNTVCSLVVRAGVSFRSSTRGHATDEQARTSYREYEVDA